MGFNKKVFNKMYGGKEWRIQKWKTKGFDQQSGILAGIRRFNIAAHWDLFKE